MPLTFPDDFDFVGVTPATSQFDLDRITRHYKVNSATEEEVLACATLPAKGDAHPLFSKMFVTDLRAQETGESACVLDVNYMGAFKISGDDPVLPPQRRQSGGQVASATTNTDSDIFPATVTNPATVQFYAITNTVSLLSTSTDPSAEPDDPPEITALISWDLGFGLQPGYSFPDLVTFLLTKAFVQGIIEPPPEVDEIVAGQYYRVTKRKTRTLFPYAS